ncbi:hypothetical protein CDCA_CDCA05G1581 [Cyanidium caldarium]|uniref:Uncharacterized protein n=1 Tax=Cyanidium caldarium TaxID=2771 RepID=A0AAV9IU16_CYACA|nr:hypothetical protein CDCA_CDCA05G1581 [Cyanidium caldarium]
MRPPLTRSPLRISIYGYNESCGFGAGDDSSSVNSSWSGSSASATTARTPSTVSSRHADHLCSPWRAALRVSSARETPTSASTTHCELRLGSRRLPSPESLTAGGAARWPGRATGWRVPATFLEPEGALRARFQAPPPTPRCVLMPDGSLRALRPCEDASGVSRTAVTRPA